MSVLTPTAPTTDPEAVVDALIDAVGLVDPQAVSGCRLLGLLEKVDRLRRLVEGLETSVVLQLSK